MIHTIERDKERTIVASRIITHVKGELLLNMRFLDFALAYLRDDDECLDAIRFGTNGRGLFYNRGFIIDLYYENSRKVLRLLLHTLLHALFNHPFSPKISSDMQWDLACDICVESIIDDLNIGLVEVERRSERLNVYKKLKNETQQIAKHSLLIAEVVWLVLNKKTDQHQIDYYKSLFTQDCHDLWGNRYRSASDDQNKNKETENEDNRTEEDDSGIKDLKKTWTEIMDRMVTNLETFTKNIGNQQADLLIMMKIATRKKYDYKDFLNQYMVYREVMKESLDEFDYIYYTYGLTHYQNMPLIESIEYREQLILEEFVIVIDTSGSVFYDEVILFLQTMYSILLQNISHRKVNLHIIQADMIVQKHHIVQNQNEFHEFIEHFSLVGGGGTDFKPAFTKINQMILNGELKYLKGMLYFTDGFGEFPEYIPAYDCVFVFFSEFINNYEVPFWAKKLILTKADFIEEGHK